MKKWNQMWMMVLLVSLLTGCGAGVKTESTMAYDMASVPEAPAEAAIEEAAEAEMVFEESNGAGGASVTSTTGVESVASTSQKLIKTVGMNLETKEFDQLLEHIKTRVEEIGGYIENSEISGNSYYSQHGNRYAWLTLRIPAERLDGFVTIVEELGNVTSKRESVEDITLKYVDVASHKEALKTEQERLMTLLEQAESMEDIIAIESRLSQVRYELQSYESTLRTYDNQVNYSTVTMDIYEVERVTKAPEKKSFFEEIRYRLEDNFYDIGQGLRSFAIWFISSLPYLVIWAAGIFVVILVGRRIFRRKWLGKTEKKEMKTEK